MREKVECASCGENFDIDEEARINDIIYCPECGSGLRVVSLDPAEVEIVEKDDFSDSFGENGEDEADYKNEI